MSSIVKYACEELDNAEISCFMFNGEPYFKGIEVARVLGHDNVSNAVYKYVPLKFKNKLSFMTSKLRLPVLGSLSKTDLDANWISEAGLYKLVFKSRTESAEIFTDWVCEEVLPQIRKTGSYMSHDDAVNKIKNPTGETKLHYKVKSYIARKYPHVIISAGQGENQTT